METSGEHRNADAIREEVQHRRAEEGKRRLELGRLDPLSLARPLPVVEAEQDGQRDRQPADVIRQRARDADRLRIGIADQGRDPADGLERRAVADIVPVRAGRAEARHLDHDRARV